MSDTSAPTSGVRPRSARPAPAPWSRIISPGGWVQIAVLAVLMFLAYRVQLIDLVVYRWRFDPNWSHGWLVPLFSLYFVHTQRHHLQHIERRPSVLGLLVLLGAMAMYFSSLFLLRMGYPQVVSFVVALLGLVLFLGGWQVLRYTWFPVAFLLVAIPLPESLYVKVTMPLRKIASEVGATLLSLIPDLHAETSGVTIDYMYRMSQGHLNVEEACSGMRLMMAFVTLGLAMAYLGQRPLWHRVLMVACCVPIALACNVLRVTLTGVVHVFGIESLASGAAHELLGLAMLPVALGLFALVGYVLKNLFVEAPEETA